MIKNLLKSALNFAKKLLGYAETAATVAAGESGTVTMPMANGPEPATAAAPAAPVEPETVAEADVQAAIAIVNNIKNAMGSPVAVLITNLIPGGIDDAIREELIILLPVEIAGLTMAGELLRTADKSAQLADILAKVKFSDNIYANAFYHTLATRMLQIISGGKVSWSSAVQAIEFYFKQVFKPAQLAKTIAPTPVAEVAPAVQPEAVAPVVLET